MIIEGKKIETKKIVYMTEIRIRYSYRTTDRETRVLYR